MLGSNRGFKPLHNLETRGISCNFGEIQCHGERGAFTLNGVKRSPIDQVSIKEKTGFLTLSIYWFSPSLLGTIVQEYRPAILVGDATMRSTQEQGRTFSQYVPHVWLIRQVYSFLLHNSSWYKNMRETSTNMSRYLNSGRPI